MLQRLAGLLRDEDGPTAAEYAMLLALLVAVVIMAVQAVGNTSSGIWSNDTNKITTAIGGS
ncbi:MAG: Flp family type IVb pilin [Planctomycetaceae bacterium]|nr:Flp family type IVb pilin [Planctomycetaceae bacterium]